MPRQHVERLDDGTETKLDQFVSNARRRAAKLSEQRRADLGQLGMRR